jgi:hypothetical protein
MLIHNFQKCGDGVGDYSIAFLLVHILGHKRLHTFISANINTGDITAEGGVVMGRELLHIDCCFGRDGIFRVSVLGGIASVDKTEGHNAASDRTTCFALPAYASAKTGSDMGNTGTFNTGCFADRKQCALCSVETTGKLLQRISFCRFDGIFVKNNHISIPCLRKN